MAIKDYSTFIPTGGVDWAKLTNDIVGKVNQIGTSRQAEKDALDLMMTDANALMNKEEMYSSQKLQEFVLAGANSGREQIAKWNADLKNGILSPKDYKNRMNNIKDGWATLANSAKTYDKTNQEFMRRQTPDAKTGMSEGSEFEEYLAQIYAEVGQLGDKRVFFDPQTGKNYTAKVTENGLDQSTMTPTLRYAAPNNFFDNNVDIMSIIDNGTKDIASYKEEIGNENISDPLRNQSTANAVVLLKQGIMSNPRYVAQVLNKSGDYDYYRTDAEKENKVLSMLNTQIEARNLSGRPKYTDEEIAKLKNNLGDQLIKVSPDNTGVYQPVISEKQLEVADKFVLDQIKSRIEYEKSLDEPVVKAPRTPSPPKEEKPKPPTDKTPEKAYSAWIARDWKRLATLIGGGVTVKFDPNNGVGITKKGSKDGAVYYNTVYDLWDQFGYTSPSNRTDWDALMEAANKKNPLHIVK